ncbi:MAG: nitroreductase family protein, partial [Candidatus Heimdallarchaeaceae archaeon]
MKINKLTQLMMIEMKRHIGHEFMEKTKYKHTSVSDQREGLPQPQLELEYAHKMRSFDLPKPTDLKIKYDLKKAIEERKSARTYSDDPLTLEELSWLLWATQGIKEIWKDSATLRNVPSAGARHA